MQQNNQALRPASPFKNEAEARKACAVLSNSVAADVPRIKSIAAVGALDAEIGSERNDSLRLAHMIDYLLRSGFIIDPDFTVDPVNFTDGRDFLQESTSADLVFISLILNGRYMGTHKYNDALHEKWTSEDSQNLKDFYLKAAARFGTALSPDHDAENWRRRARTAGAKMVVTYGGDCEIGTKFFCQKKNPPPSERHQGLAADQQTKHYEELITTPSHAIGTYGQISPDGTFEMDNKALPKLKYLYNNYAIDVPLPWYGFAADKDYLEQMQPALEQHGQTYLTQKALGKEAATYYGYYGVRLPTSRPGGV